MAAIIDGSKSSWLFLLCAWIIAIRNTATAIGREKNKRLLEQTVDVQPSLVGVSRSQFWQPRAVNAALARVTTDIWSAWSAFLPTAGGNGWVEGEQWGVLTNPHHGVGTIRRQK